MRINPFDHSQNVGNPEQISRKADKKTEQAQPAQPAAQEDVKLSPQLQERLAKTPDIRQERVAEIKQAREAGTYNVSDSQLADAMFKEFFKRG